MQDNSFEEQFKAAVELPRVETELPIQKSQKSKLVFRVGMIAGAMLMIVGIVLVIMNIMRASDVEQTIMTEELSQQIDMLREQEAAQLEKTGFSADFYEALAKSSDIMDDVYAEEDRLLNEGSNFWQYITGHGAIYCFAAGFIILIIGILSLFIDKGRLSGAPLLALLIASGMGASIVVVAHADIGNSGGALQSISLAEFMKDEEYIKKLVPGSDIAYDSDYYANTDFQNSVASHASFALAGGGSVEVYEDEIGLNCDILGVKNYLVDFTQANKGFTQITRAEKVEKQDDKRTRAEKAAMLQNTIYLQLSEYCAAGRNITITIPKGEYYFAIGHHGNPSGKDGGYGMSYVIRPVSGVNIVGRGIGMYASAISAVLAGSPVSAIDQAATATNGTNATILKPYTKAAYNEQSAPDMFRFNNYADSGFEDEGLLENISYKYFIVDGEDAVGFGYNSAGKGFMYNLFKNISWDSVVVKNTDGTGFGVDCPIGNGNYIKNSLAMNNGKKATDPNSSGFGGASGFGIGTGYKDNESLTISNSVAYGNSNFGFFFEHQNRFWPTSGKNPYNATEAISRKGFKVSNSVSANNLYNYGGMRAYDTAIVDSVSVSGSTARNQGTYYAQTTSTASSIYYSGDSRRVSASDIAIKSGMPSDVQDSTSWYYDAVKWAFENGVSYGVGQNKFGVGQQTRRSDAVMMIWRMMGAPGDVVAERNGTMSSSDPRKQSIKTCFSDVAEDNPYVGAIKWAYDNGVTIGTKECQNGAGGTFEPNKVITRAELVTMLWRLAGAPTSSGTMPFDDVPKGSWYEKAASWAVANGITDGIGDNKFAPEYDCTREQTVTFLYRYFKRYMNT